MRAFVEEMTTQQVRDLVYLCCQMLVDFKVSRADIKSKKDQAHELVLQNDIVFMHESLTVSSLCVSNDQKERKKERKKE